MATSFIGAWRSGTDGHYLWQGSDWTHFQSKWNELSGQGLRLTDITTYVDGGQRLWAGVWRAGTDGHYLWVGADWSGFQAKWNELSGQGLRLVDIKAYVDGGKALFAGVWRAGTDAHYLWSAPWNSFQAKWTELSGQGLRLVAIDTFLDGGQRMWIGVWRAGSDGHYLWAGADWAGFQAKWKDLAGRGCDSSTSSRTSRAASANSPACGAPVPTAITSGGDPTSKTSSAPGIRCRRAVSVWCRSRRSMRRARATAATTSCRVTRATIQHRTCTT
jgi:hypothetical protein